MPIGRFTAEDVIVTVDALPRHTGPDAVVVNKLYAGHVHEMMASPLAPAPPLRNFILLV